MRLVHALLPGAALLFSLPNAVQRSGGGGVSGRAAHRVSVGASQTTTPLLLVLAKTDHVLSLVDPTTGTVLGRVPSGPDPHEVVASADGRYAYISNYGSGAYNTITAVDLVKQQALAAISLGALRGPHGLEFAAGKVWFTAEAAKAVGSYDPATGMVDWVLGTGQNRTHMLVVSSDAKRVITTNVNSATVSVLELSTRQRPGSGGPSPRPDWDVTVVPVGNGAEGLDVSPDGKEAWVANAQDGTISIVDLAAKRVVQTLAADVRGANRLKFTPDGALAFVSTLGGPDVTVLRVASRSVLKRVAVGRGAAGIVMQPDGARAYVACTPDDNIAVIDVRSLTVINRIVAGKQPDGLAWATRP